jgi:hypothetical protein
MNVDKSMDCHLDTTELIVTWSAVFSRIHTLSLFKAGIYSGEM